MGEVSFSWVIMTVHPPRLDEIKQKINLPRTPIQEQDHFYQFGRNPVLTLAEINALYLKRGEDYRILQFIEEGVFIRSNIPINVSESGAILRHGRILGTLPIISSEIPPLLTPLVEKIIFEIVFLEEKCNWTITLFNFPETVSSNTIYELVKKGFKKGIKKQGIKRAYLIKGQEQLNISPKRLKRKQILETGMEIDLIYHDDRIYVAVTEQVIHIDGFLHRDTKRPHRRPLLLLGLALARSMINLASLGPISRPSSVYDPFCGMGSIVGEAYALGIPAFGSDIDPICVTQSQENLVWLSTQKNLHNQKDPFPKNHIFQMDIERPLQDFTENYRGAIVSEPNLLTPRENYPNVIEAKQMMRVFEDNYYQYFNGLMKCLKEGQTAVIIFPRIHTDQNDRVVFDYPSLLKSYNCQIISFNLNNLQMPAIFVHAWKKHIIEREIVVFQRA